MNREFGTDIQTLIQAQFVVTTADYSRVYLPGERPAIPQDETLRRSYFPFVVIFPEQRYASGVRRYGTADSSIIAWRFTTMCIGRTFSEMAYAEEKVRAAVLQKRISLAGYSSTPIQFESAQEPQLDPDLDEFITSSTVWTTVSTRAHAA